MSRKNYEWDFDNPPPVSRHTLHKHQVYEEYLERYIDTVAPHQGDQIRLSIIDGFCGGGVYRFEEKDETRFGSPVRIIETVRRKSAEINAKRKKPFRIIVNYYFIDEDPAAIECLKRVFDQREICEEEHESIQIQCGEFNKLYPNIKKDIGNTVSGKIKRHKAIFILDQYGFKEVPFSLTNQIMRDFEKAEVLLTFVPRAFLDYAGSNSQRSLDITNRQLQRLGLGVSIGDIRDKARELGGAYAFQHNEQLFLQESIAGVIREGSVATHFSKYFIQSTNCSRDLWIIHLANHYKAHDVMISVQWDSANCDYFHPGYWGLPPSILGFDSTQSDLAQQFNIDMRHFDRESEIRTVNTLAEQLPRLLFDHYRDSVTIAELFQLITNETTCNLDLVKKALQASVDRKDIALVSKETRQHRVATAAPDGAVIELIQKPLILT